jgi:hypothetical protein
VVAAAASLLTIRPRSYPVESDWKRLLGTLIKSPAEAWTAITDLHLDEISHWQGTNGTKASYLTAAITAECTGIGLLATSMLVIML